MKKHRLISDRALLALLVAAASAVGTGKLAAASPWVGSVDNDFLNAANWSGAALPTSGTTWQVNGIGSQGNPTLNLSAPLTFTTTAGKIAFGSATPSMGLSGTGGGQINLFNGTGDAIRTDGTNTITIGLPVVLGDGAASTISFTNTNTTTGLLRVTGNVTGGSGAATPGALVFSFGSTSSHNGNYEVSGNISKGGASTIAVTRRGSGTLSLSGSNVIQGLNYGTTAASGDLTGTIRVTGGETNIYASDSTAGWGTGSATNTFRVSGGVVNTTSGRAIDPSLVIDGGTLNILGVVGTGTASRFSFQNANTTFTLSSGTVNYAAGGAFGVRFGNTGGNGAGQTGGAAFTGTQSGGLFSMNAGFNLGASDSVVPISYTLSGGVMETTTGVFAIGSGLSGTTSFNMSGGKLISRSTPTSLNAGVSGAQVSGSSTQIFSFTGGTLVTGRVDAANLRPVVGGTAGAFYNNGGTIAPGDLGSSGRTTVQGDLVLSSGTVAMDIFGTTKSTVWQDTDSTGKLDLLNISGALVYGGVLSVDFGFLPTENSTFDIFDFTSQSGSFTSIEFVDGYTGSLDYSTGILTVLTVPEPTAALMLLSGVGVLALRRRRC